MLPYSWQQYVYLGGAGGQPVSPMFSAAVGPHGPVPPTPLAATTTAPAAGLSWAARVPSGWRRQDLEAAAALVAASAMQPGSEPAPAEQRQQQGNQKSANKTIRATTAHWTDMRDPHPPRRIRTGPLRHTLRRQRILALLEQPQWNIVRWVPPDNGVSTAAESGVIIEICDEERFIQFVLEGRVMDRSDRRKAFRDAGLQHVARVGGEWVPCAPGKRSFQSFKYFRLRFPLPPGLAHQRQRYFAASAPDGAATMEDSKQARADGSPAPSASSQLNGSAHAQPITLPTDSEASSMSVTPMVPQAELHTGACQSGSGHMDGADGAELRNAGAGSVATALRSEPSALSSIVAAASTPSWSFNAFQILAAPLNAIRARGDIVRAGELEQRMRDLLGEVASVLGGSK